MRSGYISISQTLIKFSNRLRVEYKIFQIQIEIEILLSRNENFNNEPVKFNLKINNFSAATKGVW